MDKYAYQAYEKMATIYEENNEKDMAYNIYYDRPGIIELLGEVKNKHVLDVGCAAGFFSKWAIDQGGIVTAIDYSDAMVEKTKSLTEGLADVKKADIAEPMPFLCDDYYDVIIASLVLHYVENMACTIHELVKKLKVGGSIVLSVHHPFMDFTYFNCEDYFKTEIIHDQWTKSGEIIKVSFYRRPLNQILNALSEHGLLIEKVSEPMPDPKMKTVHEKAYERLTKQPHFLFIKATKL